ncbi:hypothetical protein QUA43_17770 [Microcoleus sp. N9_B4]|uniref:hypothetical protein n=1 Tax=Microcoleus sp. N9_B4 TaxID=3055386 RepID=UPI002FD6EB29
MGEGESGKNPLASRLTSSLNTHPFNPLNPVHCAFPNFNLISNPRFIVGRKIESISNTQPSFSLATPPSTVNSQQSTVNSQQSSVNSQQSSVNSQQSSVNSQQFRRSATRIDMTSPF